MTDQTTSRLSLPLVQAAQAQKHVTVNESLARLDGLVNLVLASLYRSTPPAAVVDGTCYAVPPGATDAWAGQEGRIAIGSSRSAEATSAGVPAGWSHSHLPAIRTRSRVVSLNEPAICWIFDTVGR